MQTLDQFGDVIPVCRCTIRKTGFSKFSKSNWHLQHHPVERSHTGTTYLSITCTRVCLYIYSSLHVLHAHSTQQPTSVCSTQYCRLVLIHSVLLWLYLTSYLYSVYSAMLHIRGVVQFLCSFYLMCIVKGLQCLKCRFLTYLLCLIYLTCRKSAFALITVSKCTVIKHNANKNPLN